MYSKRRVAKQYRFPPLFSTGALSVPRPRISLESRLDRATTANLSERVQDDQTMSVDVSDARIATAYDELRSGQGVNDW